MKKIFCFVSFFMLLPLLFTEKSFSPIFLQTVLTSRSHLEPPIKWIKETFGHFPTVETVGTILTSLGSFDQGFMIEPLELYPARKRAGRLRFKLSKTGRDFFAELLQVAPSEVSQRALLLTYKIEKEEDKQAKI